MLTNLLALENVQVTQAKNGEIAWNFLTETSGSTVDAVISDIAMPKLNGYQLLEKLRSVPTHARTPFILISGNPDRARVQSRDADGALIHAYEPDDFFPKPFDVLDLIKRIQTLIQAPI